MKNCSGTATTPLEYKETSDDILRQNHSHAPDVQQEKCEDCRKYDKRRISKFKCRFSTKNPCKHYPKY